MSPHANDSQPVVKLGTQGGANGGGVPRGKVKGDAKLLFEMKKFDFLRHIILSCLVK
jgi:hypothetical protein